MPRELPTFSSKRIASLKNEKSCYVTLGARVYDVTQFLNDHPGGGDRILDYRGRDVAEIMDDGLSHSHSKSAYEMLDDYLVGVVDNGITPTSREELRHPDFVASLEPNSRLEEEVTFIDKSESTGLSTVTDVSMLADAHADYRIHQFLDFDQPLLKQIWCGKFSKDFYLEQVHRPRSFPSTKHVRLLGNGLESLTKYSWWVVPLLFLPFLISGLVITYNELPSLAHMALYWITGLLAWSLVEYGLHRSVFHADR